MSEKTPIIAFPEITPSDPEHCVFMREKSDCLCNFAFTPESDKPVLRFTISPWWHKVIAWLREQNKRRGG